MITLLTVLGIISCIMGYGIGHLYITIRNKNSEVNDLKSAVVYWKKEANDWEKISDSYKTSLQVAKGTIEALTDPKLEEWRITKEDVEEYIAEEKRVDEIIAREEYTKQYIQDNQDKRIPGVSC